jgi:diacylglycerol kinase family enzyme
MKRMLFVVNPCAGQRKINRYLTEILAIFNRADYEVVVHVTSGVGDASYVVQELAESLFTIIIYEVNYMRDIVLLNNLTLNLNLSKV